MKNNPDDVSRVISPWAWKLQVYLKFERLGHLPGSGSLTIREI